MSFDKKTLLIVLSVIIEHREGLVTLRSVDNDILKSEAIIRNVTNNLFLALKLKKIKERPKLRQYASVHNSLMSIALQDYGNLNKIIKLTDVKMDNVTNNFMTELNDVLDEEHKYIELAHADDDVGKHIDSFLNRLKNLKEIYGVNKAYSKINKDIVNHLTKTYDSLTTEPWHNQQTRQNDTWSDENDFWSVDLNSKDTLLPFASKYSGRRIFKGQRSKIKYFPFMAVILFFNQFQCAGSIIKSDLIITASSCLQLAWNNRFFRENPAFLSVRVGSNFYNGGGEVIPVIEVYFHPSYNPKNLRHNLCILRLSRRLKFRKLYKRVKKIDFDRHDSTLPETTEAITIIGWGSKTSSNVVNDPWTNKISFAVLDVYGLSECQDVYSKEYVTKQHFCAGFVSHGGGACNRDVGGPGVVRGKLMGVISFGSPVCGAADAPTVFTKIGYYTDWIEEIMEQDVPVKNQRTTVKYTQDVWNEIVTSSYTTTTFKLEPLSPDQMASISIFGNEDESFRSFLKTVFNSEELEEVRDYFQERKDESQVERTEHITSGKTEQTTTPSTTELVLRDFKFTQTQNIDESKSSEDSSKSEENSDVDKQVTVITSAVNTKSRKDFTTDSKTERYTTFPPVNVTHGIDKEGIDDMDIIKILDKIGLKDSTDKNIQKVENKNEIPIDNLNKTSVLTLLYLSENENVDNSGTIDNDLEEGLSIPSESSRDNVTYRNNATASEDIYDFLSKDELYDILNEAIQSEVDAEKNKTKT